MHVNELLELAVGLGASDLHLKTGAYPMCRVHGALMRVGSTPALDHDDLAAMAASMLSASQQQRFAREQELDLAYSVPGIGRFRCNIFQQRGTTGMVLRIIPVRASTLEELGLPPVLATIAGEERGLVLVTGTTGSGKSTTLAAIIEHINRTRSCHILTIEDPIEHLHGDQSAIVTQREIGADTRSFAHALRSAFRQDPDVVMVGEMRDSETIETALLAAETGHLVLSTLHTLDATEAINRIISAFPPHQQQQVRLQLAVVLRAVITMRLVPRADGQGRIPAVEVMVITPFLKDCIVDPERTHLIPTAMAQGTSQYGMQTFDQSLFDLYSRQMITEAEALRWASNADEFRLRVHGISTAADQARDQMASTVFTRPAPSAPPSQVVPHRK